jgi:prepilin-type N-terminal cleavage/methylation domain-containing protein
MRAPRAQGGYTLVEVMMALTILAIGATGIFALQTTAIRGNADAQDLTVATNVARSWIELIKSDAIQWNSAGPVPANDQADTDYLSLADANPPSGNWVTLVPPPGSGFAVPTPMTRDGRFAANGLFCAQARFSAPVPVNPAVPAVAGILVTVRVWWFKGSYHLRTADANCGAGQEAAMTPNLSRFHWVYMTDLITPHDQL